MQSDEKPLHIEKITVEIAVRLVVKISAEADKRVEPGTPFVLGLVQEEPGGPTVWKLTPVWKASMTADSDPQFTFENTNPKSRDVRWTDGHAVATEFLNLKSPEAALAFFQKYNFDELRQPDVDQKIRIRWSEIESIRKTFLSALANEPMPQKLQEFVFQTLEVHLQHDVKVARIISPKPGQENFDAVVGIAECQDIMSSLRAVVFLSRGSVWRKCANLRCEMWFKPNRPDQLYHDKDCTHRAMVNRINENTRKAKAKRRRK
jgi:hypothetical protein